MGFSNIHSVAKQQKNEGGPFGEIFFRKKSLTMLKKTERGDPLGVFNINFVTKHQQIEGGTLWGNFFPEKKSHNAKKTERGPFGLARYGMLRGKTGKTFLVQFARPNGAIWCNNIL